MAPFLFPEGALTSFASGSSNSFYCVSKLASGIYYVLLGAFTSSASVSLRSFYCVFIMFLKEFLFLLRLSFNVLYCVSMPEAFLGVKLDGGKLWRCCFFLFVFLLVWSFYLCCFLLILIVWLDFDFIVWYYLFWRNLYLFYRLIFIIFEWILFMFLIVRYWYLVWFIFLEGILICFDFVKWNCLIEFRNLHLKCKYFIYFMHETRGRWY